MKECPESDALVTVEEALSWDAESAMRHVLTCEVCLSEIRQVERLHMVLDQEMDPTPDFADRVVAALPQAAGSASQPEESRSRLVSAAIFVVATVTAFALLVVAAIASPATRTVGPEILLFACVVGFAATKIIPRSAPRAANSARRSTITGYAK